MTAFLKVKSNPGKSDIKFKYFQIFKICIENILFSNCNI